MSHTFWDTYNAAVERTRRQVRLPLLLRDDDVMKLLLWAGGDLWDADAIGVSILDLEEDLRSIEAKLSAAERRDLDDIAELARLLAKSSQDAWVIFLTGLLNRLRGVEQPLALQRPEKRVVIERVEVTASVRPPPPKDIKPRVFARPPKGGVPPRAEVPTPGHLDPDDADHDPPHGTKKRYAHERLKCRCEHCHAAYREYRARLRKSGTAVASF